MLNEVAKCYDQETSTTGLKSMTPKQLLFPSMCTYTTGTLFLTWAEFRRANWSDFSYLFTGSNLKLFDWFTFHSLILHQRESAKMW